MKRLLKTFVNKIWNLNRRKQNNYYKNNIKNKDFTIFSSNCTGGVLYHDLGLKFLSPTINLYMNCEDFIKFCEDPKKYFSYEIEQYTGDIKRDYPIGVLGDITLFFVHYKSLDEAIEKWNERKQRVNWDNIFVIATNRGGFNSELSERFDKLPYNKVLFVNKPDNNPNHFYIKGFEESEQVGILVDKTDYISGKRIYDQFDWVKFFNKENKL